MAHDDRDRPGPESEEQTDRSGQRTPQVGVAALPARDASKSGPFPILPRSAIESPELVAQRTAEEQAFVRSESGNFDVTAVSETQSGGFHVPEFERTQSGRVRVSGEGEAESARVGKVVSSLMNALVRSIRASSRNVLEIATRCLEVWSSEPTLELTVTPSALAVGKEVVFEAQRGEGEWILPLFMAGARAFRVYDTASPADLCRFADQLGRLVPSPESVSRFRDWIWCDGASGLFIELRMSYVDAFEALDLHAPDAVTRIARGEADVPQAESNRAVAARVNPAALRARFDDPIEALSKLHQLGHLRTTPAERQAMKAACSEPDLWAVAELEAAISDVRLARVVAPERIANGLWARLSGAVDAPVLRLLVDLVESEDSHSKTIMSVLARAPLGPTLAKNLQADARAVAGVLSQLLASAPGRLSGSILLGLLVRAETDVDVYQLLVAIVAGMDPRALQGMVGRVPLTPEAASTLAYLVVEGHGEHAQLDFLLEDASANRVAAILCTMSPPLMVRHRKYLSSTIEGAEGAALAALISKLAGSGAKELLKVLGDELAETGGAHWEYAQLTETSAALARAGMAADYVLPLIRSKRLDESVRAAALDGLAEVPEMLEEVGTWRLTEVLGTKSLRDRFNALVRRGGDQ